MARKERGNPVYLESLLMSVESRSYKISMI